MVVELRQSRASPAKSFRDRDDRRARFSTGSPDFDAFFPQACDRLPIAPRKAMGKKISPKYQGAR
jgi:hypothetical protein